MLRADELFRDITKDIERIDAHVLFSHFLGITREKLVMHPETLINETEEKTLRDAVKKIKEHVPTPYIVGKQSFWGRDFIVNNDVLIPRPDTETLIECVMATVHQANKTSFSLLDLGTGSGIIAITLALEIPSAHVFATDISENALTVARKNAENLSANVTFSQGSWYGAVGPQVFDLICSNPPYIESHDSHLRNLTYEPIHALTDGGDGLNCIRDILKGAKSHLKAQGLLFIEHGYDQGAAVRALFEQHGFTDIQTRRDLGGNERVTFGHLPVV